MCAQQSRMPVEGQYRHEDLGLRHPSQRLRNDVTRQLCIIQLLQGPAASAGAELAGLCMGPRQGQWASQWRSHGCGPSGVSVRLAKPVGGAELLAVAEPSGVGGGAVAAAVDAAGPEATRGRGGAEASAGLASHGRGIRCGPKQSFETNVWTKTKVQKPTFRRTQYTCSRNMSLRVPKQTHSPKGLSSALKQ